MKIAHLLAFVAGFCGIWASAASVRICIYLKRKQVPVSFLWLRVLIIKYIHQYRQITRSETGRVGPLYYHFVISVNLALAAGIAAILTAKLSG